MRRLVPWALVGLIGLGAILGAALGAAGSPGPPGPSPQQWIAGVVATTRAAGTAQLGSSIIVTSPDSALRSWAKGAGAVDFATAKLPGEDDEPPDRVELGFEWAAPPPHTDDDRRRDRHREGRLPEPQSSRLPGLLDERAGPAQFRRARARFGRRSSVLSFRPSVVPSPLSGSLHSDRLRSTMRRRRATSSRVSSRPDCPTAGPPQLRRDRTTVWVDGRGRLVQVRLLSFFNGKLPASLLEKDPAAAA